MAIGTNKKTGKSKKGGRKKAADPFLKKARYDVRTPAFFPVKSIGKTIATKTQGTKVARDTLMGRLFEVSLGDLKPETEEEAFRKFTLKVEDVSGMNCLTTFHGMDLTTDKLRSLVRRSQSLIEAYADVRTTDGFALRLFCIGFTKRHKDQRRKTSYAQASQVRNIRKRMVEIMQREGSNCDLVELVGKLQNELIGREIDKHTQAIYPLQNVLIRKVKMLRSPKVDTGKLIEAAGGAEMLARPLPGAVVVAGGAPAVAAAGAPAVAAGAPAAAVPAAEEKKAEKKAAPAAAAAAPAKAKGGDKKAEKKSKA